MIPSRICNRKTSIVLEDYRSQEELDEPVVRVIICTFEKRIQLKVDQMREISNTRDFKCGIKIIPLHILTY